VEEAEVEKSKTAVLATISLILGILGIFGCYWGGFVLATSLPAVIIGNFALAQIRASKERLKGRRAAITGIVLGTLWIGAFLVLPYPTIRSLDRVLDQADVTGSINNAKDLHKALTLYAMDHNEEFPTTLEALQNELNPLPLELLGQQRRKNRRPWSYYPGLTPNDSSSIILAGNPIKDKNIRILSFVNGDTKTYKESNAQALAKTQGITLP
jgi:hypothetical protein